MPLSFNFTDGETVITDLNSQSSGFAVNTDSNGNITLFSFYMSGPGGGSGIYAYCGGPGTLTQEGINIDAYQAMFEGLGAPCGTWTTSPGLRFVPATSCRVVDTRNPNGEFGGPPITAVPIAAFRSHRCNATYRRRRRLFAKCHPGTRYKTRRSHI